MGAEKFWDKSAEKYSRAAVRDEATYQEKLKKTREYLNPTSRVLEFGCGTGTTALHHAAFAGEILATDISSQMIEIARRKAKDAGIDNVTFKQATVEGFEGEPESFDVILALNLLHLLEDPPAAIRKAYVLLKPGGILVTGTACLGDSLASLWRVVIAVLRVFGKAPPVTIIRRRQLIQDFTDAGFRVDYEMPPRRGQAAFLVLRK